MKNGSGIRAGSIWGIPLFLDPWWFFILVVFSWDFSRGYIGISPNYAWFFGLISAFLLFGSVLLHELAHSYMAKKSGIAVESIALHPLRAITNMTQEGDTPGAVLGIAIAGPLMNLGLAAIFIVGAWAIGTESIFRLLGAKQIVNLASSIGSGRALCAFIFWELAQINLLLGFFNLIPGLPLDGGHALKAIVWKISGDRFTGIRWAAWSGQVLGWIAIALGSFLLARGYLFGLVLILIGLFLLVSAGGNLQVTNIQQALIAVNAETAMTREFRLIDADLTLRQFADEYLLIRDLDKHEIFYASANGRDRGMVCPEKLKEVDRSLWETETLKSIIKPIKTLDAVELRDNLPKVIELLETKQLRHITVLSPVGSIAGIIDRGDVIRTLARKLRWRIPDLFIQQIKTEGKFPPNLPLWELSKSLIVDNVKAAKP
jgi:Zn-dependent protease